MMKFDFWHQRRYLALQGMKDDEVLPFGDPPLVIGNVVSLHEPVWRSAVHTALALGVPDVFADWRWQRPLFPRAVAAAFPALQTASAARPDEVVFPGNLADDSLPDPVTVIEALGALRELFVLAQERGCAIETWVE